MYKISHKTLIILKNYQMSCLILCSILSTASASLKNWSVHLIAINQNWLEHHIIIYLNFLDIYLAILLKANDSIREWIEVRACLHLAPFQMVVTISWESSPTHSTCQEFSHRWHSLISSIIRFCFLWITVCDSDMADDLNCNYCVCLGI